MKNKKLSFLILFIFIIKSFSIIPEWNFDQSSIDLLGSNTQREIPMEFTKDNLNIILTKKFSKRNDEIVYTKHLLMKESDTIVYDGEVDFDDIESIYCINCCDNCGNTDRIICPKGKHHPTYFYNKQKSSLKLDMIVENGNWELKCKKLSNYFLVFYLMNGQYNFFYKNLDSGNWGKFQSIHEFYDFKLKTDSNDDGSYSMIYILNEGGWFKIKGNKLTPNGDEIKGNDIGAVTFNKDLSYTKARACFDGTYDHFYYIIYSSTSNFVSGYYTDSYDYLNIEQKESNFVKNEKSPFEFVDNVEINEIRFINNYKYAYYNISNPTNGKTYYGIIDIQTNKVVFNTDKEILSFIPYSIKSMLAITSDGVYEVCVIKKDGACIDSWDCTTGNNYYLSTEGNKCGTFNFNNCASKIYLIREGMCSESCDESIYVLNGNKCGLCSDFDENKPYKLINTSKCFSSEEIPPEAEIYNTNLNLLKCKSGYKLEEETCVIDCGSKCSSPTTIIIPPTTVLIPPTTVLIPPTTIITPPTTMIIPPTTMIIPPTTMIIPPTILLISPTTVLIHPTTVLIPPTTILTPPTTVIIPPSTQIIQPTTIITPPSTVIVPQLL